MTYGRLSDRPAKIEGGAQPAHWRDKQCVFICRSISTGPWCLHWHLISILANRRALNCDWCDKLVVPVVHPSVSVYVWDHRAEMDTFEMEIETEIKRQRQFNAAIRHFYMHPINATPGAKTICSSLKWNPHFGKRFLLDLLTVPVVFCLLYSHRSISINSNGTNQPVFQQAVKHTNQSNWYRQRIFGIRIVTKKYGDHVT